MEQTVKKKFGIRDIMTIAVPSRVMRKLVCRLWLNEVSRQ